MRICTIVTTLLIIASGSSTPGAYASEQIGQAYGWLMGSFVDPDDDRFVDGDIDFAGGQAGAGATLSKHWNVELGYEVLDFDGINDFDQDVIKLNVLNVYNREGWLSPFLLGGIGYASSDFDIGPSDDNFQAQAGIGFLIDLTERFALRYEVVGRWEDARIDDYLDTAINAGFQLAFGGAKAAPAAIEVVPADGDGDSVPDTRDLCPDTPAGIAVDANGCPFDTDGDGVWDVNDKCPGTVAGAEVDDRGCELDSDGDGVVERLDECPGTRPGVAVDVKGCEIKAEIRLPGVNFETNSDRLVPGAQRVLDDAAATLEKNPSIVVEVAGHTDSDGTAAYNLELSQRRALAVRSYLVNQGISSDRLAARGYGEEQPIAQENSPQAKAANRRVVLRVLSR